MQLTININGKDFYLRSAKKEDAPTLLKWWNDGEIMAHAGFPLGLNTSISKIEQSIEKKSENNQLLIMELDGIPFGEMNFKINDDIAEFGIKICNKNLHSKGIGKAFLTKLFEYLFNERNCNIIKCDTDLKNKGSQNFYENKMNMRKVKIINNCFTNQIGELCSAVLFEITKEEFLNNK